MTNTELWLQLYVAVMAKTNKYEHESMADYAKSVAARTNDVYSVVVRSLPPKGEI